MNTVRILCGASSFRLLNCNKSIAPVSVLVRCISDSKGDKLAKNVLNRSINLTSTDRESDKKSKWLQYNEKMYPPQDPSEEKRPAYICHRIENIKYSPDKMWYICEFIRGLSVDDALSQLKRIPKKGAFIAHQALNEAVDLAVNEHNVEFRTNLWIAEAFSTKGMVFKGLRRHAKGRIGLISYRHCHLCIRLEEGSPPENYRSRGVDRSGPALLEKWLTEMRSRKIYGSL